MSIDRRYDSFLSDLITLFQEFTVRYIKQRTIDIQKFKHYFNFFYDRMQQLQDSFHESKLKITQLLSRLKQTAKADNSINANIIAKSNFSRYKQPNQTLTKPAHKSISRKKQKESFIKTEKIAQVNEFPESQLIDNRSQTASDYHTLPYDAQGIPVRPKTGQTSYTKYNLNTHKVSKAITSKKSSFQKNQRKQIIYQQQYTLNTDYLMKKRHEFYQQLQRQRESQTPPLSNQQIKLIFQRNKNKGRWSKRGSRLF